MESPISFPPPLLFFNGIMVAAVSRMSIAFPPPIPHLRAQIRVPPYPQRDRAHVAATINKALNLAGTTSRQGGSSRQNSPCACNTAAAATASGAKPVTVATTLAGQAGKHHQTTNDKNKSAKPLTKSQERKQAKRERNRKTHEARSRSNRRIEQGYKEIAAKQAAGLPLLQSDQQFLDDQEAKQVAKAERRAEFLAKKAKRLAIQQQINAENKHLDKKARRKIWKATKREMKEKERQKRKKKGKKAKKAKKAGAKKKKK